MAIGGILSAGARALAAGGRGIGAAGRGLSGATRNLLQSLNTRLVTAFNKGDQIKRYQNVKKELEEIQKEPVAEVDYSPIYIKNVQSVLSEMGMIASSDLYKNVWASKGISSSAVLTTQSGYSVGSTPYARFVEFGRKSGKMPPAEPIRQWMESKGLSPAPSDVYAVQRHIALNGLAARNPFAEGVARAEQEIAKMQR